MSRPKRTTASKGTGEFVVVVVFARIEEVKGCVSEASVSCLISNNAMIPHNLYDFSQ